jgi:hypothetical protein
LLRLARAPELGARVETRIRHPPPSLLHTTFASSVDTPFVSPVDLRKRPRSLALAAAIAIAVTAIGGFLLASNGGGRGSDEQTAARGGASRLRTVLVSTGREPAPSTPGLVLNALRVKGVLPGARTQATVVSDRNCAPDTEGISHCTNALRLSGERLLTVRHPHRMMEVPCLEPGERVWVERA